MRKKIVAGNWKMNLNWSEAVDLLKDLNDMETDDIKERPEIIIFPCALYLSDLSLILRQEKQQRTISTDPLAQALPSVQPTTRPHYIKLGVQNVHYQKAGAYTGEISLAQVNSFLGGVVEYALVGHSERRQYFNETNQTVKRKVDACLTYNITPMVCVGEPIEAREKGAEKEYISEQIEQALFHLDEQQIQHCVIAYEPIWSIGTGVSATCSQAEEMHAYIRQLIGQKYSLHTAHMISILYGGSCTPTNASELFSCTNVDGGLIGGASLRFDTFQAIIAATN